MYATDGWQNFFVAEAGASAALLGLLFVAVSINLTKVLALASLPGRAAESLSVLVSILIISSLGLVPGQSAQLLGVEIFVVGAITWVLLLTVLVRHARMPETRRTWVVYRMITTQTSSLPIMVAGISLVLERGGGLYWLVPGVACSFLTAIVGGWVLLIEIQR